MTLIIVRHAHAGERRAWDGDDRLRPLSDKGTGQADALVAALREHRPDRILSSPALRCRQTVEPLAAVTDLVVEDDDRLLEGARPQQVDSVLDDAAVDDADGSTTVVCSHGDVIPRLLEELLRQGMTHDDQLRWQKASCWIVPDDGNGGWGAASYLAPPKLA